MKRLALVAVLVVTASSCNIPTESGEFGSLPDKQSFLSSGTSTFMERRCGSLDCHGQFGRPLRLYSEWGLRLNPNPDGSRNGQPTTAEEQTANYLSVVGLEPETLSECFESKGDPEKLKTFQLLKKPLSEENGGIRHKGGPVLRATPTDKGWLCLFGWVTGTPDAPACAAAAKVP